MQEGECEFRFSFKNLFAIYALEKAFSDFSVTLDIILFSR